MTSHDGHTSGPGRDREPDPVPLSAQPPAAAPAHARGRVDDHPNGPDPAGGRGPAALHRGPAAVAYSAPPPVEAYAPTSVAALLAGYRDPARAQLVPAGTLFDAVSADLALGLDALDLMLRAGVPVGPVAVDTRTQVRRVGFLLPPGTLARARGLVWWCRGHGLRTATHGSVLVLPPLVGEPHARLHWLVAPEPGLPESYAHASYAATSHTADAYTAELRKADRGSYAAEPYAAGSYTDSSRAAGPDTAAVSYAEDPWEAPPAATDPAALLGALRRALSASARIAAAAVAASAAASASASAVGVVAGTVATAARIL